jgi:cysteinyl-tRNA synthetase
LAILSYPYGEPFEYSEERVAQAEQQAEVVTLALRKQSDGGRTFDGVEQRERFFRALADNFDTPSAIIAICDLAEAISLSADAGRDVRAGQQTLLALTDVLGCKFMVPS